jgi:hypothetical protein
MMMSRWNGMDTRIYDLKNDFVILKIKAARDGKVVLSIAVLVHCNDR